MIDSKLLSNFSDAEVVRLKTAIANCDPRHLQILEKLDQPHRLQYLLAEREGERAGIVRDFWKDKTKEFASGLGAMSTLPVLALGLMAVYPESSVSVAEAAALCAVSGVMATASVALDRTKDVVGQKIAAAIRRKAAKDMPLAGEIEPLPVRPAEARVPSTETIGELASLARRMQERSPQEREICQILGRIISRHNGALARGTEPDTAEQIEQLQNLRTKLDDMSASDPMTARQHERTILMTLMGYGLSMPPSQKQEASLPQKSRGFALGA